MYRYSYLQWIFQILIIKHLIEQIKMMKSSKTRIKHNVYQVLCLLGILNYLKAADTTCASGQYLKNGVACQPCSPGYYCTGGTLTYMMKCSPGFYTNYGESSCRSCPAGFQCSDPTTPPVACQLGYYSIAGQASCSLCPEGSVCGAYGTVTQCVPGEICRSDDQQLKEGCPRGHKCPFPDQPTLIIQCSSGTYAAENSTVCTLCPPGSSCPQGSWTPYTCPAGTYAQQAGSSYCTSCPNGYYCPAGASNPYRCDIGQFSPAGASACIDCPAGFYCTDQEITTPTICPQGYYSTSKSTYCIACPEGYSCTDRKTTTQCATGFYSLNSQESCHQCPAGYECGSQAQPTPCSPGQYSNPGSTSCTYCPKGSYCPSTKQQPAQCPIGTYQDQVGKSYCKTCPDGYICTTLSSAPVDCGTGYYTDKYHQQCYQCPAGYDCNTRKYEEITFCPMGTYSALGDPVCHICPPGYYCQRPDIAQQACPTGTYSVEGQVTCSDCPMGFNCLDQKGKYIVRCMEGQYLSSTTKVCTECPAGYACPQSAALVGYDVMIACPAGSYSVGSQVSCTLCPPGKYCPSTTVATVTACATGTISFGMATSCMNCPQNYECPDTSSLSLCPAYFYSPAGTSTCLPCPDGMNCMYPNATLSQSMCTAGYYMSTLDYSCQICPLGMYCTGAGVEPVPCPAGQYAERLGLSQCTQCPSGYFSYSGSEFCQPSPPGSAAVSGVLTVCAEGTYSDWGYSACQTCEDGFLCPAGGMIGMHYSCPKGSYCQGGIQTKCKTGYFGLVERASTEANGCGICPAGYFCLEGTESFENNPCPRGHYCPVETGLPIECNEGTYNDRLFGMTEADCQLCPMGHQCANATQTQGDICQEGYYCPLGSYPGQYPCPAGTFGGYRTGLKDMSECQICPAGYYCPSATIDPIPSPAGYYQPYSGIGDVLALIICPAKFYCPNEAMTNYKGYHCSPGYYCPAGSTQTNQEACPEGTYSDSYEIFDASQCLNCPPGYKCGSAATSTTNQVDCPMHQYCPLRTGLSQNYLCPAGTYVPYTNARALDECLPCPYGYYCLSGQDAVICPMGYYCPKGTQYATQYACPKGHYLDFTGGQALGQCKPCGLGNYCPEGSTQQTPCPAGYYNDFSTEADSCQKCDPGRYCPLTGTILQPLCPAGKYSTLMSTSCTRCEVGYYCPSTGTTEDQKNSQVCQAGTYCYLKLTGVSETDSVTGVTTTVSGEFGLDVYPNLQDHFCATGYYCPKGTTTQQACPIGTYNRLKGRKSLLDCQLVEGGYYVDVVGQSTWVGVCAVGYYCPDGSTSATQIPCPIGTYRSITKGSVPKDCSICPSGSYCNAEGMSAAVICPQGSYCPLGTVVPEPCPIGTYGASTGLTDSKSCTPCPAGYYCPRRGQITYTDECDEGYYCIKGSKKPEPTDTVTGSICPQGGYCEMGATAPENCPAGTFNQFEGAESSADCSTCWPGYYCQGSNLPEPTGQCPEGTYCVAGQSDYSINQAQPGYYTTAGSSQQLECPRGTYQDLSGQGSCKSCEAGRYCPDMAMTAEEDCPAGYYCPSYDSFVEAGTFYDKIRCPIGTYNSQTNQKNVSSCTACPQGQYCDSEGLTAPTGSCDAGYFCQQYATTPKPAVLQKYGYYGPCPAGKYCPAGSVTPSDCPIGTFSTITNAQDDSVCQPCTPGFYCATTGLTQPTDLCDAGYYCGASETMSSPTGQECAAGTYCPEGSAYQITCLVGYYNLETQQGKCQECPGGYYCIFGGKYKCPVGYVCP